MIPTTRDKLLANVYAGLGDIAAGDITMTDARLKVVDFVAPEHEPAMLRSTLRWVLGSGDAAQPAPRLIRSAPGTSPGRR